MLIWSEDEVVGSPQASSSSHIETPNFGFSVLHKLYSQSVAYLEAISTSPCEALQNLCTALNKVGIFACALVYMVPLLGHAVIPA